MYSRLGCKGQGDKVVLQLGSFLTSDACIP